MNKETKEQIRYEILINEINFEGASNKSWFLLMTCWILLELENNSMAIIAGLFSLFYLYMVYKYLKENKEIQSRCRND